MCKERDRTSKVETGERSRSDPSLSADIADNGTRSGAQTGGRAQSPTASRSCRVGPVPERAQGVHGPIEKRS